MTDDKGNKITSAGPSVPVEVIGMDETPGAGDRFHAVNDERMARDLVQQRKQEEKDAHSRSVTKVTLEDLFAQIQEGQVKDLNLIVKADVQGSVEAVRTNLEKLSNAEVKVRVIHSGVGAISESDIMLASTSNAIIIGFNVRPDSAARESAARNDVQIRLYRVIYECIEEMQAAIKGLLAPQYREVFYGRAEVRMVYKVSGVGSIAGCYVREGKIHRGSKARVLRDNVVVYEGELSSLRRFKDDVKEVAAGYECGIGIERFNDIKEGDVIETFGMEQIKD
jgi:translation initiation factor IF-2